MFGEEKAHPERYLPSTARILYKFGPCPRGAGTDLAFSSGRTQMNISQYLLAPSRLLAMGMIIVLRRVLHFRQFLTPERCNSKPRKPMYLWMYALHEGTLSGT